MIFSDGLRNFVTSVSMDQNTAETLRDTIEYYIIEKLGFQEYHVMLDGKLVQDKPGLITAQIGNKKWCNDEAQAIPIQIDNKCYTQSAYAYMHQMPLWITAKDQDDPISLVAVSKSSTAQYVNEWPKDKNYKIEPNFPVFENPRKSWVKTSITIPLRYGEGHVFGFISFHREDYCKCTDIERELYDQLACSIGIILSTYENYQQKRDSMKESLANLEKVAQREKEPYRLPAVFLACSDKADQRVVNTIRKVILREFKGYLRLNYWKRDLSVGNIALHIQDQITKSKYGICYFSEPAPKGYDKGYVDNPNVLFEAGMLTALINEEVVTPVAWIPIREKDSPPTPFDFNQQRQIIVDRINGDIDEEQLRNNLIKMLENITEICLK